MAKKPIPLSIITFITIAVLPLSLFVIGLTDASRGTHKGFESGDFRGWSKEFSQSYSGQVVTSPVRAGKYAARFEIRGGDRAGLLGGYRAEIHEFPRHIAPLGSEKWYGFSIYVPRDWPELNNRTVIGQWHATPDLLRGEVWRSPPLAIRYREGRLRVTARYSKERVQKENDGTRLELYSHPGEFAKGRWHDWVFHVKWAPNEDGFVEAWLDDRRIIDYRGPIGYNDLLGLWFKFGIYRDDHPTTQVLYFDDYRRGKSYDEVKPGDGGRTGG